MPILTQRVPRACIGAMFASHDLSVSAQVVSTEYFDPTGRFCQAQWARMLPVNNAGRPPCRALSGWPPMQCSAFVLPPLFSGCISLSLLCQPSSVKTMQHSTLPYLCMVSAGGQWILAGQARAVHSCAAHGPQPARCVLRVPAPSTGNKYRMQALVSCTCAAQQVLARELLCRLRQLTVPWVHL